MILNRVYVFVCFNWKKINKDNIVNTEEKISTSFDYIIHLLSDVLTNLTHFKYHNLRHLLTEQGEYDRLKSLNGAPLFSINNSLKTERIDKI